MRLNISIWLLSFFLFSCATTKYNENYSEESVKKFSNFAIVETHGLFYEINGDERNLKSELSDFAKTEFHSTVHPFLKKSNSTYYELDGFQADQVDSMKLVLENAYAEKDLAAVRIPMEIYENIKEDKIIFNNMTGWYKVKGQRVKEFWKSLGIGLLTLGMFIPIYYSYETDLFSVMVDKIT